MRAAMRVAAVELLEGFKASLPNGAIAQIYPSRPMSIQIPSAFVDSINEPEIVWTNAGMQRTPAVTIRFVRGSFSTADVAEANDALMDGFVNYVRDNFHAAGANTITVVGAIEDDDGWIPEWIEVATGQAQRPYYSSLVSLAGEGLFGGLV